MKQAGIIGNFETVVNCSGLTVTPSRLSLLVKRGGGGTTLGTFRLSVFGIGLASMQLYCETRLGHYMKEA